MTALTQTWRCRLCMRAGPHAVASPTNVMVEDGPEKDSSLPIGAARWG